MSIKNIETMFSKTLKTELNVNVEITCRDENAWTVSGPHMEAVAAAVWLDSHNLMSIDDMVQDDELDETFVYMTSK
jgi:hypothetical protein